MVVSDWSLSETSRLKSPGRFSVLVTARRPISNSSRPLTKHLGIVIIVTFMILSFFSSLARSKYFLSFRSLWFSLWDPSERQSSILLFYLIISRSGLLAEIKWSVCIPKSKRISLVSLVKFQFLEQFSVDPFLPTQSCIVFYSFYAYLLHLLNMWKMLSILSSHNLDLLILLLLLLLLEFFTPALADGLSLEFEWQQVSSSLQDSSQYSGRSQ